MSFDFRPFAHPDDPHADRFEEWVAYYAWKREIAAYLEPSSILEVGVRYGYSAAAFLDGAPGASYLGIDADDGTWGGVAGATEWACAIIGDRGGVVTGDALNPRWWDTPRQAVDLVHLDGPQDEASWDALIELALPVARWVLLDGTRHTKANARTAEKWRHLATYDTDEFYGQMLLAGQR